MWSVTFDKDRYFEVGKMRDWCDSHLSKTAMYLNQDNMDADIRVHYVFGQVTFYFKHKEEYNWFMLRWG